MTLTLRQFFRMCGFPGAGGVDELRGLATVVHPELEQFPSRVSALDVMRRFSQIPDNPDFTLDLNVDPTTGTPPLELSITVAASVGASPVINTNLDVFDSTDKSMLPLQQHELGGGVSIFEKTSLGIGSYQAKAVRTAATKNGPATLTRTADIVVAKKVDPPPQVPPVLTGWDPKTLLLTGKGFVPSGPVFVEITMNNSPITITQSNGIAGSFNDPRSAEPPRLPPFLSQTGLLSATLDPRNFIDSIDLGNGFEYVGIQAGETLNFTAHDNRTTPSGNHLWSDVLQVSWPKDLDGHPVTTSGGG